MGERQRAQESLKKRAGVLVKAMDKADAQPFRNALYRATTGATDCVATGLTGIPAKPTGFARRGAVNGYKNCAAGYVRA